MYLGSPSPRGDAIDVFIFQNIIQLIQCIFEVNQFQFYSMNN
jgi:hypothetical protein